LRAAGVVYIGFEKGFIRAETVAYKELAKISPYLYLGFPPPPHLLFCSQAAGVIHTDFEKGFIRAETVAYKDLVEFGSMAGAKEAGKVRAEGKEYEVQDGDVMLFRFNR